MNDEPTRLQRLQQQKAKLDQKIRAEQQKIARTERKNDTRRKILIGACVDDMLKTGKGLTQPDFHRAEFYGAPRCFFDAR